MFGINQEYVSFLRKFDYSWYISLIATPILQLRIGLKHLTVKKKIVEHPFHKVSFDYDEKKEWTPRDEKLLNTYLQLHDSEKQRQDEASSLRRQFSGLEKHVERVRKELKQVEKKITATRNEADHIIAQVNLQMPRAAEKFSEQVNGTNDDIQDYHKKMQQLEKEINELNGLKDKYIDDDEQPLWERLSELKITYAHDNRLSTDYVSFDDDEQRFRDKASYISHQNDKAIDYCDRVIDNYNRLLLETTVQYEVWNEFGRRLKLIEQITSSPGMGISGN